MGPYWVDTAFSYGVGARQPHGVGVCQAARSYSVAGSRKPTRQIGDAVGATFAVLECAIERGDEIKLPLDSCNEGPIFANALQCLVPGGYAELYSPQYPRRRLGAQTMLPVPKSRGVQCLSEPSVAQLMFAIFIVNKTSSSVTVPSTKQGPCSDSARSGPTPGAISKPLRLFIGQCAREICLKRLTERFASAGRCLRPGRDSDEISWFLHSQCRCETD